MPDSEYREIVADDEREANGSDLRGYLSLLEDKELDILICDASLIPFPLSPELKIAAVPERTNPFNVFISEHASIFEDYRGEMPIEVFSPVIKGQLIYHHPAYKYVECDRNFYHCYRRMVNEECGGFVLPAFVVETLNQQGRVVEVFSSSVCMPLPGQGTLALITRKSDRKSSGLAGEINNPNLWLALNLERKFAGSAVFENRCVGALCTISGLALDFSAVIVSQDGSERFERAVSGKTDDGEDIIRKLIDTIYSAGSETGTNLA
ncbi:MAG: hypothetical protein R6U43_05320 [Candidatus Krumholzibacteriales bacterium]